MQTFLQLLVAEIVACSTMWCVLFFVRRAYKTDLNDERKPFMILISLTLRRRSSGFRGCVNIECGYTL
jgi:hypothetical protein